MSRRFCTTCWSMPGFESSPSPSMVHLAGRSCLLTPMDTPLPSIPDEQGGMMPGFISDSPLARELISIGNEAIATEDDAKLRAYFREDYVFHGPGADLGFDELSAYFASLRAAFSGLRLFREQIIVDGNYLAARTTFSGDFTGLFTYSPIGPVEPTGQHLEWEVIGTFRYDDEGRLAEEWVQTDYRSFLSKLGVTTTESAQEGRSRARIARCVETSTFVPACRPAFGGPMPDKDVTSSVHAPTRHRSQ